MSRLITRLLAMSTFAFGVATMCSPAAKAIDVEANDFVDAPDGTNVVLGYYQYQNANKYNSTLTGTSTGKTNLDQNTGIFRYVYYNSIFNVHYAAQFLIPFAGLSGVEIGGAKLNSTFGAADPIVSVGFWPVANVTRKQYVSIFSYTSLPIGSYNSSQALSIGANRWQQDTLIDYTQKWWKGLTTDVSGDYIFYGTNSNVGIPGQSLKQKATWVASFWLDYDTTPTSFVAVGWVGNFGGIQSINGHYTGSKTEFQQIRAEFAYRPEPTVQLLAKVYHDINVVGGFQHEIGIEFRIVKAF